MFRILAVATNTFREAVRDRVLYGVLGMALLFELFALALGEMALDQGTRVVLDIGLAALSLFSVLVAVFLGSSLLYKEIDRKTLYVILPKPLRRHEFLLGKFFGIVVTALVFICLTASVQLTVAALQVGLAGWMALLTLAGLGVVLVLASVRAHDKTAILIPWSLLALLSAIVLCLQTSLELGPALASVVLVIGEVVLLTAVALLFSSFSTPFLTAMFTVGVWLVGRSADTMATMKSKTIPVMVKAALSKLVYVWPNFHLFVPGRHTLTQTLPSGASPLSYTASTMTYAVAYAAILLMASALIFRRRDFL